VTSRDLAYWLQGFIEIHGKCPTPAQWEIIKNHVKLVFVHEIDPSMPDPTGEKQAAHNGTPFDNNMLFRC
jgi:hypothetical protein